VTSSWVLDLVERVGAAARGATVSVALYDPDRGSPGRADPDRSDPDRQTETVAAWCRLTGNELVGVRDGVATVRRGRSPDPLAGLDPSQRPGTRLWMYTNFDCNLSCEYCCVRSSPHTARRALGRDRVQRLAAEAVDAGVTELVLTGGEPFLLPDIDPVSAEDPDHLVTRELFPLRSAIAEVRRRFAEHRSRATTAAQWSPCA